MIRSEAMAGTSGDRARELNTTWREAVDTLAASRPSITVRRVPAGHDLVATHPEQVLAHILPDELKPGDDPVHAVGHGGPDHAIHSRALNLPEGYDGAEQPPDEPDRA
jgi:hypothetical protein